MIYGVDAVGHLSRRCVMLRFHLLLRSLEGFYMADGGTGCTLVASVWLMLILGSSWLGVWLTLLLQYGVCRLGRSKVAIPSHTQLFGACVWLGPSSFIGLSASSLASSQHSACITIFLEVQLREGALSPQPKIVYDTFHKLNTPTNLNNSKGSWNC